MHSKSAAAVDKTLPDQRVFNEQGQAIRPSTMTPSSVARGSVAEWLTLPFRARGPELFQSLPSVQLFHCSTG